MTVKEKITGLRQLMREHNLSAYIVPGTDPHASEYMASHWQETTWLSGFKGEAGTVVVTLDQALLWTDSRYYLQANKELDGTGIGLMKESEIDTPTIFQWLAHTLSADSLVGVNPEMWSVDDYAAMRTELADSQLGLLSIDLIRPLWIEDRPALPNDAIYVYSEKFAGESAHSKLARMRQKLVAKHADTMLVSALDEVAWLLNIRGNDIAYNPVVISYVVLEQTRCTLFVASDKLTEDIRAYLHAEGIDVQEYTSILDYLHALPMTASVLYDGKKVNEALYEALPKEVKKINAQSPILVDKSHKNEVELAGERQAMIYDSVALTKFFYWLETEAFAHNEHITEWDLMEKLHSFRMSQPHFVEESFCTIAGYQGNGAIVHYEATKEHCAEVHPEGMLLLDSGGQYLDGTTDITRTIWLGGAIPEQAKKDYTYVLKGHIALSTIQWPRGTRGNQLDALAKQYMWQAGITFGHGTGHGVGHFLGCHEGPQNVRTDNNPTPLELGNICSDEPGIYRTDQWGIRIENLVAVTWAPRQEACTTEDEFYRWEVLTLCYYDTNLIDKSLMTTKEIAWINAYHKKVYDQTAPYLTQAEADFLKDKCKEL